MNLLFLKGLNLKSKMNQTQELPPGMILHCGGETVSRNELSNIETPEPTESWCPLPHENLLSSVEIKLRETGFEIEGQTHAVSKEGNRYFGLLQVKLPSRTRDDFSWIVALRNSHDKTFPAGLVAGTRVTVCDNLCFSGEVKLSRKHTKHALRDLPSLTARAIGKLSSGLQTLDERIDSYNGYTLNDPEAHDVVIRSLDSGAISARQVPYVLQEWRKPSHDAFQPRTAWSLFNAFTESHKGTNPAINIKRGEALHGIFDSLVLAG